MAAAMLGNRGYHVLEARSGADALRLLEGNPARIDLLLADIVMSGMNGRAPAEAVVRDRPVMKVREVFDARQVVPRLDPFQSRSFPVKVSSRPT